MILVTGGCGFIGGHLVDRLIEAGKKVIVLDDLSTGNYKNPEAVHINRNITANLADIFEQYKIETIYHLAAHINLRDSFKHPVKDAESNIIGTINLINMANAYRVEKFIFTSTGGAIYSPDAKQPWHEQSEVWPKSPYALSKLSAEKYIKSFLKSPWTILRLANVYGPRQNSHGEAGVIAIFLENIKNGKPLKIFGDGSQVRDYVYVQDVINACVLSSQIKYNDIFNVSTKVGTDLRSLTMSLLYKTKASVPVQFCDAIPGELQSSVLDNHKIYKDLSPPALTSLDKGLDLTIEWYDLSNSK